MKNEGRDYGNGFCSAFLDKYINQTKAYKVPTESIRWCVKNAEEYINAHPSHRLAQHLPEDIEPCLKDLGRNRHLSDWQFKQAVEALKILFVDMLKPAWADFFRWEFWMESATKLPNHRPLKMVWLKKPRRYFPNILIGLFQRSALNNILYELNMRTNLGWQDLLFFTPCAILPLSMGKL